MRAVLAIARKDLRLMFRDKGDVFFTFVFPVLMAMLFGFVFRGAATGGSRITVALVVESDSRIAAGLAEDLGGDASLDVRRVTTRAEATDGVREGTFTAAIILPQSMQAGADRLFSGGGIPIEAIIDPVRRAEAGLIQGKLNELAFRQFPKLLADDAQSKRMFQSMREAIAASKDMGAAQKLAAGALIATAESFVKSMPAGDGGGSPAAGGAGASWSPVQVRMEELPPRTGVPRSSFDVSVPQGMVWGIAGCVGAFAASVVTERSRGTLARLRLAPITRAHLLAGKGLACFVTALLVELLLIVLAVTLVGARVAQPGMLALACVLSAFAFAGLAMLIAGFCRTEAEANGAGRGALLLLALIGGGTIPLFFMPPILQTLSYASPFRWAVIAIEGPFWRDVAPAAQVTPLVVLAGLGFGGFAVGSRLGAFRDAR